FTGKRAMCSLTAGGHSLMFSEHGINGPISSVLFPIHHGILQFVGFTVIEPFIVYAPARLSHEERLDHLIRYRERVLALASAPTITGPNTADYDERLVLRSASCPWP
ncbi:MAG: NAD(P)H-dependent oxidoreductase, partial [Hyphomicrobiales bacterium]|nr:NAD(P)H-dependent oxidoreductase [Hyphomicrobiales bacterium]